MAKGIGIVMTTEYKRGQAIREQGAAFLNAPDVTGGQNKNSADMQIDAALDRLIGV